MSLTSLSLIIIIILMEGAGALVIHKSKNHMVTKTPICRRVHDYCGFAVLHSVTKLYTPIPGWCECDATAGSACIFSTINSKKQWVFTCQKASQTEANQEGPVRVSFKYFMDQYRQLKKG